MATVKTVSDYFSKLEETQDDDLKKWQLDLKEDQIILENKLGNRLLYPFIVPQTEKDLLFNFLIIKKAVELNLARIYSKNLRRIDIPEAFLEFIPDLRNLVKMFIDTVKPNGITTLSFISNQYGRENAGTLIRPDNLKENGFITIGVKGQEYQIKAGSLVIIPIAESKADIVFTSTSAKLMGKKIIAAQIAAGKLGLIVDARI